MLEDFPGVDKRVRIVFGCLCLSYFIIDLLVSAWESHDLLDDGFDENGASFCVKLTPRRELPTLLRAELLVRNT